MSKEKLKLTPEQEEKKNLAQEAFKEAAKANMKDVAPSNKIVAPQLSAKKEQAKTIILNALSSLPIALPQHMQLRTQVEILCQPDPIITVK